VFYEPSNKGDPMAALLESRPKRPEAQQVLDSQLREAALVRVLVVDERVQMAAESVQMRYTHDAIHSSGSQDTLKAWLEESRVFIPDINLSKLRAGLDGRREIESWLQRASRDDGTPLVLVVHEGILEHVGLREPEKARGWFESIKGPGKVSEVVVTSGRGIPAEVPAQTRFIQLSLLLRYTVEARSKFHLLQALIAAQVVARKP
jgi:hypothetical protein